MFRLILPASRAHHMGIAARISIRSPIPTFEGGLIIPDGDATYRLPRAAAGARAIVTRVGFSAPAFGV
jgi:hypothetical protein